MGGGRRVLGYSGIYLSRPGVDPTRQAPDVGEPLVDQEEGRLDAPLSEMTVDHDRTVLRPPLHHIPGQGFGDELGAIDAGDLVFFRRAHVQKLTLLASLQRAR